MISEALAQRAQTIRTRHEELFRSFPRYQLDLSWPAIGTLDLLATQLRTKTFLTTGELELFDEIVAYVGAFLHDVWTLCLEEADIQLAGSDRYETDVFLSATRGKIIGRGNELRLPLTAVLRDALFGTSGSYPTFLNQVRERSLHDRRLSSVVLGLLSFASPQIAGLEVIPAENVGAIQKVVQALLSDSSAFFYARCFPGDSAGSDSSLYSQGLILPPIGFEEKSRGLRSAAQLYRTLLGSDISNDDRITLLANLTLVPDEQIEMTASAVLAGVMELDSTAPELVHRLRNRLQIYRPGVLPAIQNIRALRGKTWTAVPADDGTTMATGDLLPLLSRLECFGRLSSVLEANGSAGLLAELELVALLPPKERAIALLSKKGVTDPASQFMLQLFGIDEALQLREVELPEKALLHLKPAVGSQPKILQSAYASLCAQLHLLMPAPLEAEPLARRAYELSERSSSFAAELLAESISLQNPQADELEALAADHPQNVKVRLAWINNLRAKGATDRVFFEMKSAAVEAGNDPRFFASLTSFLAEERMEVLKK